MGGTRSRVKSAGRVSTTSALPLPFNSGGLHHSSGMILSSSHSSPLLSSNFIVVSNPPNIRLACWVHPRSPNWSLPSRPCLKPATESLLLLRLFSSCPYSTVMPAMALSQPGSAEKTIRKIDIAQVSIDSGVPLHGKEKKIPYKYGPAEVACLDAGPANPSYTT